MSAPTLAQLETAIHTWVSVATGLPAAKVIWRNQDGPRPARPFITIRMFDFQELGTGWTNRIDNPLPSPGQEIVYQARGQERVRISFEAITDAVTGNLSAPEYLRKIRGISKLPNVKALLVEAKLGPGVFGPITSLDFLVGKAQQLSRATMDCFAYIPTEFTQTGTFIETEDHTVTPS